jgi:hypothetical protein
VRTNESHQLPDAEAHIGEASRQFGDRLLGIRKETIRGDVLGCGAPDERRDLWASRTGELYKRKIRRGSEHPRITTYHCKNASELRRVIVINKPPGH